MQIGEGALEILHDFGFGFHGRGRFFRALAMRSRLTQDFRADQVIVRREMFDLAGEGSHAVEFPRRRGELVLVFAESSRGGDDFAFDVAYPKIEHLAGGETVGRSGERADRSGHEHEDRGFHRWAPWSTALIHLPRSDSMNCLTPARPVKRIQKAPFSRSWRRSISKKGQQRCSPAAHSATRR